MLEAAGGAKGGTVGTPLATTFLIEQDFLNAPDVGNTTDTASLVPLSHLPISGMLAANVRSALDDSREENGIDVFACEVPWPARLIVDVLSQALLPSSFDPFLRLYDIDGTTGLAENDSTSYAGNMWNNEIVHTRDSSLLNILLPAAGTYYLEIQSAGDPALALRGPYNLLFGIREVPEPGTCVQFGAFLLCAVVNRRRRPT